MGFLIADFFTLFVSIYFPLCDLIAYILFHRFPVLAIQQAINDPQSQKINEDASQCTSRGRVIKWLNKPSRPSPIKRTINFNEVGTSWLAVTVTLTTIFIVITIRAN